MITEAKIHRVYNPHKVTAHPVSEGFKMTFAQILTKDYGSKTYGFSKDVLGMLCIDHDSWEKSKSGDDDKTMDCSTGISTFDDRRREYSNHRHLLIELKLKCKSHTLSKTDYTGKIKHSRSLLAGDPLYPSNIFIFVDNVQRKAKSILAQWSRGSEGLLFRSIVPITPTAFNSFIGFEHEFPYQPVNTAETIRTGLISVNKDAEALYKLLLEWKNKVSYYIGVYNQLEAAHICRTIVDVSNDLLNAFPEGIEKELIRLELNEFKKHFA